MIRLKVPKAYSYIWDIVRAVKLKKKIPVDVFHLIGGRKSAKTTTLVILWIALCVFCDTDSFGWMSWRKMVQDSENLYEDIIAILEAYEVPYTSKKAKTNYQITVNGNTMKILGINNQRKVAGAKRSGLPRFSSVKYAFIFFEERFEFDNNEIQSILEATRSISAINNKDTKTQLVVLNACNPWAKSSPYIAYCAKIQPWSVPTLKNTGSQLGIYDIKVSLDEKDKTTKRELFHYTNWRVAREYLGESEIKQILDTWNIDKVRAATVDYGLPGYEQGAIYTHVLNFIQESIFQEHEYLLGGMDYGWGRNENAGKTVCFFGGASLGGEAYGIDIYNEYVQSNYEHAKRIDKVAEEIVSFYVNSMREYCNRIGWNAPFPLKVKVDNAAAGVIDILNIEAKRRRYDWLRFVNCKKEDIQNRIEITLWLMGKHLFRINSNNVKLLKEEFELSNYEDSPKQKRANINDHAINAYEYMIEPVMWKFARNKMNYMKGYKKW